MTDLLPIFPALSPEDTLRAQESPYRLLFRQARLFAPDSTSLPNETAALASSILLTLGADRDPSVLLSPDLDARFQQGQRRLRQKLAVSRQLCRTACLTCPPLENHSLADTLHSLTGFPDRYDWRFFTQELPADIDYQLSQPVPDTLQGIDYVNEWLRRLCLENEFLNRFEPSLVRELLTQSCPDYHGLLINLYEPVTVNALGLALLGDDPRPLSVSHPRRNVLETRLFGFSDRECDAWLLHASAELAAALDCPPSLARHLKGTALALRPRLQAALRAGMLEYIFLAFRTQSRILCNPSPVGEGLLFL